jgi:uncharacterized protein YigE (DUF2233 family)
MNETQAPVLAPDGRETVEGVIQTTKYAPSNFGGEWKMTVRLTSGARVYVTIPKGCHGVVGRTVKIVATFKRSERDPSFAVGSRPKLVTS